MNRREVLTAGGCAICASILSSGREVRAEALVFDGCLISPDGYRQYRSQGEPVRTITDGFFERNRHWRTTGSAFLDRDLDRALGIVADLFSINPAFGFYDPKKLKNPIGAEQNGMNAFATMENTDIHGTRGTVGFGWDLFQKEFYEYDRTGVSIMTILAHEFGHILQGERGFLPRMRIGAPRKSEVNADFLSGYFLGTRKRLLPKLHFEPAGEMLIRYGRKNDGKSERTHGNSQERLDAAEAGFRLAYVENMSLDAAFRAGLEYVGLQ